MSLHVDLPDEEPPAFLSFLLPDLENGGIVGLDLRLWRDQSGQLWLTDADGLGAGLTYPGSDDESEALALIADQVQEEVIEARWRERVSPVAWPECRIHHSHPLEAVVQNGLAVWACPNEPAPSYPIGSLPESGS